MVTQPALYRAVRVLFGKWLGGPNAPHPERLSISGFPCAVPCTPFRQTREAYASTHFGLPLTVFHAMSPTDTDPPDSRMQSASTSEDDEEFGSLLAFAKALSRRPQPEMADWYLKFKRLMVRGLQCSPCTPLS